MLLDVTVPSTVGALEDVADAVGALLDALSEEGEAHEALIVSGWPYQQTPTFTNAVVALAELPQAERQALAKAYDNDRTYTEHADDATFAFAFCLLGAATKSRATTFFRILYERLLGGKNGFVRDGNKIVQRGDVETSFLESNADVRVCPACLSAQLLGPIAGRSTTQLDHVLPKSRYGVLAVHPWNLLPICSDCNWRKSDADPLTDGSLPTTFLPYLHAGLDRIEVEVLATAPGAREIRLRARTPDADQPVAALERLLHLSERWSAYLHVFHVNLLRHLQFEFGPTATADDIREWLLAQGNRAAVDQTRLAGKVVEAHWQQWLANEGINTLLEELRR